MTINLNTATPQQMQTYGTNEGSKEIYNRSGSKETLRSAKFHNITDSEQLATKTEITAWARKLVGHTAAVRITSSAFTINQNVTGDQLATVGQQVELEKAQQDAAAARQNALNDLDTAVASGNRTDAQNAFNNMARLLTPQDKQDISRAYNRHLLDGNSLTGKMYAAYCVASDDPSVRILHMMDDFASNPSEANARKLIAAKDDGSANLSTVGSQTFERLRTVVDTNPVNQTHLNNLVHDVNQERNNGSGSGEAIFDAAVGARQPFKSQVSGGNPLTIANQRAYW